ncbi:hypothetical protein GCM10007385_34930 [Tateyamaria omphalii]|uniref:hypothetical protein n=1 Tax=Tateyamaria omphalii TaxID=299262 RepID=UPI0016766A4C|nr:hypothetical protein [Tateyamaria omphalii]GGX62815.1 hypothetical protein GCM10007385_34930 [Tateyamaria omphalii]
MAPDAPRKPSGLQVRFGHPGRLLPETRELTLVILGHLIVFMLSIAHDEIVAEMVSDGWIIQKYAERFEILMGLILFMCWGALTLRFVTILRHARAADGLCRDCSEPHGKH